MKGIKTLLYIHGLGSDRNSRKFQDLKAFFGNTFDYDFLEWDIDSDISALIDERSSKYCAQDLIIVGDSTGANFAYQLRERIREQEGDAALILTSPLLDISHRIADFAFPPKLIPQLWKIENPVDALIIASKDDEVLNQKVLFEKKLKNVQLVEVDDGHRLENFHTYIPRIKDYIFSQKA